MCPVFFMDRPIVIREEEGDAPYDVPTLGLLGFLGVRLRHDGNHNDVNIHQELLANANISTQTTVSAETLTQLNIVLRNNESQNATQLGSTAASADISTHSAVPASTLGTQEFLGQLSSNAIQGQALDYIDNTSDSTSRDNQDRVCATTNNHGACLDTVADSSDESTRLEDRQQHRGEATVVESIQEEPGNNKCSSNIVTDVQAIDVMRSDTSSGLAGQECDLRRPEDSKAITVNFTPGTKDVEKTKPLDVTFPSEERFNQPLQNYSASSSTPSHSCTQRGPQDTSPFQVPSNQVSHVPKKDQTTEYPLQDPSNLVRNMHREDYQTQGIVQVPSNQVRNVQKENHKNKLLYQSQKPQPTLAQRGSQNTNCSTSPDNPSQHLHKRDHKTQTVVPVPTTPSQHLHKEDHKTQTPVPVPTTPSQHLHKGDHKTQTPVPVPTTSSQHLHKGDHKTQTPVPVPSWSTRQVTHEDQKSQPQAIAQTLSSSMSLSTLHFARHHLHQNNE